MAIKPILFNTDMVRAILDGRKTCARRAVKSTPKYFEVNENPVYIYDAESAMGRIYPPCQPEDVLYVRETWCGLSVNEAGHFRGHPIYYYRADGDLRPEGWRGAWHPSIHMPKEAARIWLKVTDVRVERLQNITEDGAKAEGANWKNGKNVGWKEKMQRTAIERFAKIWDSTIKKSDLDCYGWNASPWVWAIEFERCEKPEVVK